MPVPFFDITRQNNSHLDELNSAISQVVSSGRYILGENVSSFEKEFSVFCGVKHAIGVASGTEALHLALLACGIKEGDEVVTSPFTFVATAEAIVYCGARPVFVDIEPNTFNMDPDQIEKKLSSKTKAILPVHLYGLACEMDRILDVAKKNGILIVEDCAQATGAIFDGEQVGSFGQAGCFSFFPTKNFGCFGDGGLISSNDEKIAEVSKILRGHGSRKTYHYDMIGFNSRLDELQAAILRIKLKYFSSFIDKRVKNAQIYFDQLSSISEIGLPSSPKKAKHTYNQFTIRIQNRDRLFDHLKQQGIASMVYYPLSLHLQSAFSYLGHKKGDFPNSEKAQDEVLSLPIFPELTQEEILEVCKAIKEFYGKN